MGDFIKRVPLYAAAVESDIANARKAGGELPAAVRYLHSVFDDVCESLPFPAEYYDHVLGAPLRGCRGVSVFPVDSIWFDSNHPAGRLRAIYRLYSRENNFAGIHVMESLFPEMWDEIDTYVSAYGLGSWRQLDEIVFVFCLCRDYHNLSIARDLREAPLDDEAAAIEKMVAAAVMPTEFKALGFNFSNPKDGPSLGTKLGDRFGGRTWKGLETDNRELKEKHMIDSVDEDDLYLL